MRIHRTGKLLAATVMTIVAVASVITFSRADVEPGPAPVVALPGARTAPPSVVEDPDQARPAPTQGTDDEGSTDRSATAPTAAPRASAPRASAPGSSGPSTPPRPRPRPTRSPSSAPAPSPTASPTPPNLLDVLFPKAR